MNTDTRLTLEQISTICAHHNIPYKLHSRINSGFSHEVHRLNDDLVIKLFNTHDSRHYDTELSLLASDADFPKPRLMAKGGPENGIDRNYIIMSYVPGAPLGSRWHLATDLQRENLIKEISVALKSINKINPYTIALRPSEPWDECLLRKGKEEVELLRSRNIIDRNEAETIIANLTEDIFVLANSQLYPVYWDIHFDNFIVNDEFELQAIIDLENVEITSLDYPIFVLQKQMDEPEKYLRKEDEKYADKKDYTHLKDWYRKYYPEMFAFDDLDVRLKIYQLLDTLHLLADWPHVKELYKKLNALTR